MCVASVVSCTTVEMLLVGVGGSGKQPMARLASHICNLDVFQVQVTANYGIAEFRLELQQLYLKAGQKNH